MGTPLKNPPVYLTLVQARFNPVLKLADYVPSIQEGMRKAGYPAYAQLSSVVMRLPSTQEMQQQPPALPQPTQHVQYTFSNVEQTHSFVLGADALTFHSSDYGNYKKFSDQFLHGLAMVHEQVKLDFTERIGLRYLDHVAPRAGEQIEQYLVPEVLGLGSRVGGKVMHAFSETFCAVEKVRLRVRVLVQGGGLVIPPDLAQQPVKVQERFLQPSEVSAMVDTDGFVEGRELFAMEAVRAHLDTIHGVIGESFKRTVTPHALKAWDE